MHRNLARELIAVATHGTGVSRILAGFAGCLIAAWFLCLSITTLGCPAPVAASEPGRGEVVPTPAVGDAESSAARQAVQASALLAPGAPTPNPGPAQSPSPGAPPPGGPPPGGPPPGGPPPLPVLLGIADFLIAIDRPFDAEGIYRGILAHDPNNGPAQAGLRRAKLAQRPTMTALWHQYKDSHDVTLRAYGGGPTFRTRWGNITVTAGTGHYKNDNNAKNPKNPLAPIASPFDDRRLRKSTLNLLLEPHHKNYEGRFFVSRVTYDTAPDRTLYDVKLSLVPVPNRKSYSVWFARRDSILQSAQAEFFAPETFYTVLSRLLIDELGGGIQYPMGFHWDLAASYSHFDYSDGNKRDRANVSSYYRLKPRTPRSSQMPVFRLGLGYIYDNTQDFAPIYYSPQNIHSLSLLADYVLIRRGVQYGIFAGYPVWDDSGTGFAKHEPAKTLFGFLKYDLTDRYQLYVNLGTIRSPGFDLNFTDVVVGVNARL